MNKTKKLIIIILIILILLIPIIYILINNYLAKPTGNENITTKLNEDTDYLYWFIDFDNLYQKNIKSPKYSLNKEIFQEINNFITNEKDNNVLYRDNTYYINNKSLELDVNTRSLRYTNDNEILEINLLNGKYYIQYQNNNYLYKIILNNRNKKIKKYKNKKITSSIYNNNNFTW